MIAEEEQIGVCDVVVMELLSGVDSQEDWGRMWSLLNRFELLPMRPLLDYELAAALFQRCKRAGFAVMNSNSLLVAAVAIHRDVPVLAEDEAFEQIAAVSGLELAA